MRGRRGEAPPRISRNERIARVEGNEQYSVAGGATPVAGGATPTNKYIQTSTPSTNPYDSN